MHIICLFSICYSARFERKNIYVETAKEKIDEYINGANVTRTQIKIRVNQKHGEKEKGQLQFNTTNCRYCTILNDSKQKLIAQQVF